MGEALITSRKKKNEKSAAPTNSIFSVVNSTELTHQVFHIPTHPPSATGKPSWLRFETNDQFERLLGEFQ